MHYINSLKESIKNSDIKKAKALLDQFTSETDETKLDVINELAIAPDNIAWDLLYYLALEINIYDKDIYNHIIQLIMDRAHINFKFAIILYKTGKIKQIKGGIPLMKHILTNSTDQYIISETIETAGKEKIEALTDDIAEYIYYDNDILKEKAVNALGRIGSESAIFRLKQACTTKKCDINIVKVLSKLGAVKKITEKIIDTQSQKPTDTNKSTDKENKITEKNLKDKNYLAIYEQIQSKNLDKRFEALNLIGEMEEKDQTYIITEGLKSDNHDLKVNILRFLTRAISEKFLPEIYAILNQDNLDPKIRFAALEALYAFPKLNSVATVLDSIESPYMFVRMAAAKVMDKNLSDFICAEIKDRIESGRDRGEIIVQAIIDTKSGNLIDYLMISDTFSYITSNYFSKPVPNSFIKKYIEVLNKRGLKATAKKFETIYKTQNKTEKPAAMVISPSPCIQNVYEKLLFQKGYTYIGYKSCQDAFEAISISKPELVICDLFLHTMTGIDFVKEIREFYSEQDLAFIISSTQKDFTGQALEKACKNTGVTDIMEFPIIIPKADSIK